LKIDRKVLKEDLNGNIRVKETYLTILTPRLDGRTNIIDKIYIERYKKHLHYC
jgi:hypothetical protein